MKIIEFGKMYQLVLQLIMEVNVLKYMNSHNDIYVIINKILLINHLKFKLQECLKKMKIFIQ